jgi:hypothetical protein
MWLNWKSETSIIISKHNVWWELMFKRKPWNFWWFKSGNLEWFDPNMCILLGLYVHNGLSLMFMTSSYHIINNYFEVFFLKMCYWKTFGFFPLPFLVHKRSTPKFYYSIRCHFLGEECKTHVVQINNTNHNLIQDWIFKIKLYWVHLSLNFGEMVLNGTTQGWACPQFNIPCNFD